MTQVVAIDRHLEQQRPPFNWLARQLRSIDADGLPVEGQVERFPLMVAVVVLGKAGRGQEDVFVFLIPVVFRRIKDGRSGPGRLPRQSGRLGGLSGGGGRHRHGRVGLVVVVVAQQLFFRQTGQSAGPRRPAPA